MKTSNKILLGTFLLVLVIITSIHVAIYAKYKSNDYITLQVLHEERYATYALHDIQSVYLAGLQSVTIIPADTAKLEIEKEGFRELRHDIVNGVLTIKGDSVSEHWSSSFDRVRNSRDVIIYLPRIPAIRATYCELNILGVNDTAKALSFSLDLTGTTVHFTDRKESNTPAKSNFDKLTVTGASHSSIEFSDHSFIKELNLSLDSSRFDDGGADCRAITIHADNESSVKMNGKNINKTKFISQ
jgi:hypothetical protein